MARIILAGILTSAAACFAINVGVGVFGGVAMPTGKMATWENSYGELWENPLTGSDLGLSPKFGGKFILSVLPAFDVEAAVAYHLGHPVKDWQENDFLEEPKSTLIPVTVGANYKFALGNAGLYAGGGFGYYLLNLKGGILTRAETMNAMYYTTDVSLNSPGVYFGGGFTYSLGNFALDVSPRFNYVFNSGPLDFEGWGWSEDDTRYLLQVQGMEKDYNDTYVDILVGANYYFM